MIPRTASPLLALALALTLFLSGCAEMVEIRSYPGGAKALIDGRIVGTTPATAAIPRNQVGLPHKWRVEYRNCDYAEGDLHTGIAGGRIVAYIFTAGFFALFRGPYYYPEIDAMLTGGDCEGSTARQAAPQQPGILIQNVVGERNQATTSTTETSKTQRLSERLTTLRDLYNRKLISQEIYDQEMQKAVRDSQ